MSDYDEPENFDLCGVSYRATKAQANLIAERLYATGEWLLYAATDIAVRNNSINNIPISFSDVMVNAKLHAEAFRGANKVTNSIVRDVLS